MRIAINTISVDPGKAGIKTYLTNLVRALVESKPHHDYHLLCSPRNESLFRSVVDVGRKVSVDRLALEKPGAVPRIWFDQIVVPRRLGSDVDLLLTPSNVATLATTIKQVVVVQAPLAIRSIRVQTPHARRIVSRGQRLYYDLMMPLSMRAADRIVAVSHHLAAHIRRSWPDAAPKLAVIHEGVDASGFEPDPPRLDAEASPEPYLLFVGTLFPYKNVDRLLQAFARVKASEQAPARLRLRIAGRDPDGRQRPRLEALAADLGLAGTVEFLGSVPHDEIADLYRGARVFVFPSAVETFGLPVLEAMAAGVPVIASDRMSVPEVVAEAGVVVDPDDPPVMAHAITRVLGDDALRSSLAAAGRQRVRQLTWRHVADEFDALFAEVSAG